MEQESFIFIAKEVLNKMTNDEAENNRIIADKE